MINVVKSFLHNNFEKKTCEMIRILPSTQRYSAQSFSQLFLVTNEMDEKIHTTFE